MKSILLTKKVFKRVLALLLSSVCPFIPHLPPSPEPSKTLHTPLTEKVAMESSPDIR